MATLSAKILKHHKKADGTYNVKICVSHKRERKFIDTEHYVTDKQLTKSLSIKDVFINKLLNNTLDEYRLTISKLGKKLELFDVQSLKEYLISQNESIDFLKFCQIHIDALKKNNQLKSASNYNTVFNNLKDFFGRDSISVEDITVSTIHGFAAFLRNERIIKRKNQFGKIAVIKAKGVSDASVHNYLRDFKGFFTAAKVYYNKPSLGLILIDYNPFDEYRIAEAPETLKRNIDVEQLKKLRDCIVVPGSRAELARDMFMLSFYLCGINAVDLYNSNFKIARGRVEYNRSKTKGKRKDRAFISIKIPEEAVALLSKYGNNLQGRYSSIGNLNAALSSGMKEVSRIIGVANLTYYWSRHTFGNLARNVCRKSKDDVALALNHVDHGRKTTDIYLSKDWTIVDEVQEAVISLLRSVDRPIPAFNNSIRNLFNNIQLSRLR